MDLDEARRFIKEHHRAVVATRRRDGTPQMSVVLAGVDDDGRIVISTREWAAKARNVRRNPNVSVLVMSGDGWKWVQVDGKGTIISRPEAMELLVDYYRGVSGEHPDWDEYREAMDKEQRCLLRIEPERAGPN